MIGWILQALAAAVVLLASTAALDFFSEELRGWLDLVPRGLLRIAAAQLGPGQRENVYSEEWLPELQYILRGKESRPITRLIIGMRFAAGLAISARRVARRLDRGQAELPAPSPDTREHTISLVFEFARGEIVEQERRRVIDLEHRRQLEEVKAKADFYVAKRAPGTDNIAFVVEAKDFSGKREKWQD